MDSCSENTSGLEMKPIVVLNCFRLCLLVLICTADAVDSANGVYDDAVSDVAVDDTIDDAVDDVAVDDAVDDVAVNDKKSGGAVDDTVADGAVDDANSGGTVDDADYDGAVDDTNSDGAVDDVNSGGAVDDAVSDGAVDDTNSDGAVDDANSGGAVDDADYDGAVDDTNSDGAVDDAVSDGAVKDEVDDGVQDDEAVDDNTIDDDLLNNPSGRLDQTSVDPVFKLSAAEIKKFKLWPEAKIPYFIDEFSYDKVLRDKIREHLEHARRRLTFVHFHELPEPLTDDNERWVFFVNRRGQLDCKDYSTKSFTNKGVQKVVVGYDCFKHNGPMAAIVMALLGVSPMHNAPDRDKYITINKDHILPDKMGLFKRLNNDEWLFHDIPYDYNSVSHYPLHKYTADGSETITINNVKENERVGKEKVKLDRKRKKNIKRRFPPGNALTSNNGEAKDYSYTDKKKVALLYKNIWHVKAAKGLELEDCKALYRAGPGLNTRLNKQKELPEKPKPKLYLTAIQKLYGPMDAFGETLSSLERK